MQYKFHNIKLNKFLIKNNKKRSKTSILHTILLFKIFDHKLKKYITSLKKYIKI